MTILGPPICQHLGTPPAHISANMTTKKLKMLSLYNTHSSIDHMYVLTRLNTHRLTVLQTLYRAVTSYKQLK